MKKYKVLMFMKEKGDSINMSFNDYEDLKSFVVEMLVCFDVDNATTSVYYLDDIDPDTKLPKWDIMWTVNTKNVDSSESLYVLVDKVKHVDSRTMLERLRAQDNSYDIE